MNQTWCSGFCFSLVQLLQVTTCWVSHQLLTLSVISCRRWDDPTVAKEGLWLCHNCTSPSVWLIFCTVLHLVHPFFFFFEKKKSIVYVTRGHTLFGMHFCGQNTHNSTGLLLGFLGGGVKKSFFVFFLSFFSLFCCCCYCVWYIGKMSQQITVITFEWKMAHPDIGGEGGGGSSWFEFTELSETVQRVSRACSAQVGSSKQRQNRHCLWPA